MIIITHLIRMAFVSVAMICDAEVYFSPTSKWCSFGFNDKDELAELVFFRSGPVLRMGGKTSNLAKGAGNVTFATIGYRTEGGENREQQIAIYRDRVFWPCNE